MTSETGTDAEVDLKLTIASRTLLATGVLGIDLCDPQGQPLPRWTPGAHIDLNLPNGMIRQYSLCGDPADRSTWRIGVLDEADGRGGSRWLHTELQAGDHISVRGPRNNFPLVPRERLLFIAGGIGVTPLLPMVAAAQAQGIDWTMLYGGRTLQSMAFRDTLARYESRVLILPEDQHGLLPLAQHLGTPRADTAIYACGPEPLLAAVEDNCRPWGPNSLHVERFHPRAGALDGVALPFEVVLEESGLTVQVAANESIVDAVTRLGVDVATSCREGTCGTCETTVLDGVPDHRDSFLSEEERADNTSMMICCSRALSPSLTLDL